jgi:hypothetical protein
VKESNIKQKPVQLAELSETTLMAVPSTMRIDHGIKDSTLGRGRLIIVLLKVAKEVCIFSPSWRQKLHVQDAAKAFVILHPAVHPIVAFTISTGAALEATINNICSPT